MAAMLLTGCLDYTEEMWLKSDLSGEVALTISLPEEFVKGGTGFERDMSEDGIRRDVERIPGVNLESFESFRDAGKMIAKLRLTFDSVEKLTRHESNASDSGPVSFLGAIAVHRESGKVVFERTLRAMPQTKSDSFGQDLLTRGLGSFFLSNNYLTYKLHVPSEIITANSQHIEGSNQTVEWKFTLAQALRDPPVMRVEWKKSSSLLWLLIGCGLVGAVGIGVIAWSRKSREKGHATDRTV